MKLDICSISLKVRWKNAIEAKWNMHQKNINFLLAKLSIYWYKHLDLRNIEKLFLNTSTENLYWDYLI